MAGKGKLHLATALLGVERGLYWADEMSRAQFTLQRLDSSIGCIRHPQRSWVLYLWRLNVNGMAEVDATDGKKKHLMGCTR